VTSPDYARCGASGCDGRHIRKKWRGRWLDQHEKSLMKTPGSLWRDLATGVLALRQSTQESFSAPFAEYR
jgi:hypothetical protein